MLLIAYFILTVFASDLVDTSCGVPFCAVCKSGACTKCVDEYLLDDNGQCKFKTELHCGDVDVFSQHICEQCLEGYKMNYTTMKCEQGQELCTYVAYNEYSNPKSMYCSECVKGYIRGPSGCVKCEDVKFKYCHQVEKDDCNRCTKCIPQATKDDYGVCQLTDVHCLARSQAIGSTDCKTCAYGYYFEGNLCQKGEIEDCLIYKSKNVCKQCINGKFLSEGKCTSECKAENCEKCLHDKNTKCAVCKKGYSLSDSNTCLQLSENCLKMNSIFTSQCGFCVDGYALDTNDYKCKKCGDGCANCKIDDVNYCESCLDSSKTDVNGKCVAAIKNCWTYTDDGLCSSCNTGYTVSSDKKQCTTDGCYSKSDGKCNRCLNGYYMTKDSTCEKCDANACLNGQCINAPKTCKTFNMLMEGCFVQDGEGRCKQCLEGYRQKNGKCVVDYSSGCGQRLIDGTCVVCVKNLNPDTEDYTDFFWPDASGNCPKPTNNDETGGNGDGNNGGNGGNGNGTVMMTMLTVVLSLFFLF